ncbi:hypothetical protein BDV3_005928 [Batrachochytrium dendrobatidis]
MWRSTCKTCAIRALGESNRMLVVKLSQNSVYSGFKPSLSTAPKVLILQSHLHSSSAVSSRAIAANSKPESSDHVSKALSQASIDPISKQSSSNVRASIETGLISPVLEYGTSTVQLLSNLGYCLSLYMSVKEKGQVSKRVDIRHFVRTKQDFATLVPGIICLVASKLTSLQSVMTYAPSLIPTVFYNVEIWDAKVKSAEALRTKQSRIVLDQVIASLNAIPATRLKSSRIMSAERKRTMLVEKLSAPEKIKESDLLDLYPFIHAHFNIATAPSSLISSFGKLLHFTAPALLPRSRLLRWGDWMLKDDLLIKKDGVASLSYIEVLEAIYERGLAFDQVDSKPAMAKALVQHAAFSAQLMESATSHKIRMSSRKVSKNAKSDVTFAIMDKAVFDAQDMAAITMILAISRAIV